MDYKKQEKSVHILQLAGILNGTGQATFSFYKWGSEVGTLTWQGI